MPSDFVFLKEYKVRGEIVWEYSCRIIFNQKEMTKLTITEYYRGRPGRERINNELVCELMAKLRKRLHPTNYPGLRKAFRFETSSQGKDIG